MKHFYLFVNILLFILLGSCGSKNSKSTQEIEVPSIKEEPQQPRNKNYIGREIPVKDDPESDFKIVIAKITDTFENSSGKAYSIRFWITPKKNISIYNSQYQTQWGSVAEKRLPKYDISNYYLFLKFVTSEGETISCDMISPYSNLSSDVVDCTVNPKYRAKMEKVHMAGEWCHEEGTKVTLFFDKFGLIEDLDHIEFMDREDFKQWLFRRR